MSPLHGKGAGRHFFLAVVLGLSALVWFGLSADAKQEEPFPHADHQGLFPLCTGCHEGIPRGVTEDLYPDPASCAGCHNGVDRDRVSWAGPSRPIDNVEYDHVAHATDLDRAGDPPQACASCHVPEGAGRMEVSTAVQVGTCFACHAHEAEAHFSDARCESCHVTLASSQLGRAAIEALPVPPDHESAAFVAEIHGSLADTALSRCATCHTRERCVACHVDVDRAAIEALPAAPPTMELPLPVSHYPEPASHVMDAWLAGHGQNASVAGCATCHTSEDCTSCHVQPAPEPVPSMPSRSSAVAPGVGLLPSAPENHESFFFMEAHAGLAASDGARCATCHVESYCVECHDGPVGGGYHPADFVSRHAANAFSGASECANCHSTEVFCRQCHQQVGLTSLGRLGPGYHDGGPLWLLRHGQAARQNLEGCSSCHRQVDCTQCHGALGAFSVSPHGTDFDAARGWARSPRACLGCHIRNPLG